MRFLKVFSLFISLFFFGAIASAKETTGFKTLVKSQEQSFFQKAEPHNPRFLDLVIEEIEDDSNENEDEVSFHPSCSTPSSQLFSFSHQNALRSVVPTSSAKLFKYLTCRFIIFRNIRL
jgi:hypothetical protein